MSKTTKQTGTKTIASKITPKERVANRAKKVAAKHQAIREAGKPKAETAKPELMMSVEQMIANAAGKALAGKPAASGNPLIFARGSEFTDALNAATVAQLEEALKHPGMSNQCRNRIGIALKLRAEPAPADDVAKTVAAVTKGDLTKGVEVPMPAKKTGKAKAAKAPKADGKMSGLDAAAKVLAESADPLNAKQIIEQAAAKGYWTSPGGKTPHATIYAAMTVEIAKKGDQARFKKADRGLFTVTAAGKQAK